MFILFLFVLAILKPCHCYFGITRSSLYEKNESTWIAWRNEEIPPNLQQFFKFDGTTLLVTPPNGLSIEFVIARLENENKDFIAEWCAPSKEEYDKCDYDLSYVCNTVNETQFSRNEICNLGLTSSAFARFNETTVFLSNTMEITWRKWSKVLSNPSVCHHMAIEHYDGDKYHSVENFIGNKWIRVESTMSYPAGGLKYTSLPRHSGYQQSGRMLNAKFCDIPFRFPNSGIVFQKGIRRIRNVFEVLEGPPLQILLHQSESNFTVAAVDPATTILPPSPSPSINYLIAIIFGGICVGIICIAFACLAGTLLIRKKRRETFDGRPSFSLETFNNNDDDDSGIANPPEIQSIEAPPSSKQSISKIESVQNDCGYSKLVKTEFEISGQVLPFPAFKNKNQSIIQFLTQEFESSTLIKGPKSVDELLQEVLEEPMAENRAEKLLQVVVKANNELFSLGYLNKLVDSSKFHLKTPPNSDVLLKNLKGGNFLKFVISVCEKDIDGKNGEFEDDPKRWKKYVEEVDVGECFRHACLFGQTMKRRQFFVLATFYKVSLLIAENPNRNDLLSMKYPIPFFIILCEKYPHYFEIH